MNKKRTIFWALCLTAALLLPACVPAVTPVDTGKPPETTLPPETTQPPETTIPPENQTLLPGKQLSDGELKKFEPLFWDPFDSKDQKNLYFFALHQTFASPEEADIPLFLAACYNFDYEDLTEKEIAFLKKAGIPEPLPMMTRRIPAEVVETLMEGIFGISLEDNRRKDVAAMPYWKETDCYYNDVWFDWSSEFILLEGAVGEDGLICLRYDNKYQTEGWVLTLREDPDDKAYPYEIVSNLPLYAAFEPEPFAVAPVGALSREKLDEFQEMFSYYDYDHWTWYNFALTSTYDSPDSVDLSCLFYNAFPIQEALEDYEVQYLEERNIPTEMDIHIRWNWDLDVVLRKYFGVSFADSNARGMEHWLRIDGFMDDSVAYVDAHSDTLLAENLEFLSGEKSSDGIVTLRYRMNSNPETYEVTIQEVTVELADGTEAVESYRFLSNQPVEE